MVGQKSVVGERIEEKVQRIMHNNEPITDGAPQNFTDPKDGVPPEFDIRTSRWDLATEAKDAEHKTRIAKREGMTITPEAKGDVPGGTEGEGKV